MKKIANTLTALEDLLTQSSGSTKCNFSHIVASTDFSPSSERAVDYALQLARRLGAKLTLLHIVPEPSALDYSMEGGDSGVGRGSGGTTGRATNTGTT